MKCKLCKLEPAIENSHIIPKFVFRWLKNSGTGGMRNLSKPNLVVQDGVKVKFLCTNCEKRFSAAERYFANNIFFPVVDSDNSSFKYDENFKYFIISVFWRLLKESLLTKLKKTKWYELALKAEVEWSNYLLLNKPINNFDKINLLIGVDIVDKDFESDPNFINRFIKYMSRETDAGIPYNEEKCLIYFKIPRFLFVITFSEFEKSAFINSEIREKGNYFTNNVTFNDLDFSNYLIQRVEYINEVRKNRISDVQKKKSYQNYLKQKDKIKTKDLGKINEYLENRNKNSL